MIRTYSDLMTFWQCPRRWAYSKLWEPAVKSDALLRGSWVHMAASAYWQGINSYEAILKAAIDESEAIATLRTASRDLQKLAREAINWWERYRPLAAEVGSPTSEELFTRTLNGVAIGGHPDCVGLWKGQWSIIELKTGKSPSAMLLDISGQADYYAWLVKPPVTLVVYHLVSEKEVTFFERPPRLDRGLYIAEHVAALSQSETLGIEFTMPKYGSSCYSCPFQIPCTIRDQGGDEDNIFMEHFVPRVDINNKGAL